LKAIRTLQNLLAIVFTAFLLVSAALAQDSSFHGAPASAKELKNPYEGQQPPNAKALFHLRCARCHGENGEGSGNIPPLKAERIRAVTPGEIFWFITKGDVNNGMPSWATLPKQQRWQIVTYVQTLGQPHSAAASEPGAPVVAEKLNAPPPTPPFTDFRYEKPGQIRKIALKDLPAPFATPSAGNGPRVVARPEGAWPQVPPGFKVEQYAAGLDNPRIICTAPNGDFFVAETGAGDIKVFRGITSRAKPEQMAVFASDLKGPFGIAFYPPGPNPQWVYVGNLDTVVRFPYQNGDLEARGPAEHIADIPDGRGHTTRNVQFSLDGKKMFVAVGSGSNVDDPDTTPAEKNRADVLEFNPDGSGMRVFAYGIRNCVGLMVNSKTGELWCSVNERDGLGDNLVPDYITHVQDGGFYGWPWWYMGGHQDPRLKGKHPELQNKVITPDVILNPHNASLGITFYDGKQFPAEYQGDLFASEHGSWNRAVRVGYELIRVPMHQTGHASGEYQDFMTGFVVDNEHVWGRPVGVTTAPDGSLLVTDDGSNSIWRISYTGK
jgi:glucose/arabinose dehydrogenase/mono/diheme cytochrome c family protein